MSCAPGANAVFKGAYDLSQAVGKSDAVSRAINAGARRVARGAMNVEESVLKREVWKGVIPTSGVPR